MNFLPGTTVEVNKNNSAQAFLDTAFALNGLVLSQVVQLTGLEPYTIQNWVKRKFIPPPEKKKYGPEQFCRITIINMLKDIFQIERIVALLQYVCSAQPDINDVTVYLAFCDTVSVLPGDTIDAQTDIDGTINKILDKYALNKEARKRFQEAIKIMTLAFISARVKKRADMFLLQIEESY